MGHIFISYSHKDKDYVHKLQETLKNKKFNVWVDERIEYDTTWPRVIQKHLDDSDAFIVVMTENSYNSEWVQNEVTRARRKHKPFFALLLSGDTWLAFEAVQYEDVIGGKLPSEKFYERLASAVSQTELSDIKQSPPQSKIEVPLSKTNLKFAISLFIGLIIIVFFSFQVFYKNTLLPLSITTLSTGLPTTIVSPSPAPVSKELTTTAILGDTPSKMSVATPTVTSSWQQGKIAYIVRNAGKTYLLYTQDLSRNGQPRLLLSPEKPTLSRYYAPWFAPDGQSLAFEDRYRGRIFVTDVENANIPKLVGSCSSPSFSPEGTRIVCDKSGSSEFPVYDVQTGTEVGSIYQGKSGAVLPAWSPDGIEIAFSILEDGGRASVWKVGVDGGNPTPLVTDENENYAAAWSPDGEWIAFQSTLTSDESEIWIMRRDGTGRKQITFSGGGKIWSRGPCFSPDGKWLAFVSSQGRTGGTDFGEVFVISLDTGELHQVTNTDGFVYDWRVTWAK